MEPGSPPSPPRNGGPVPSPRVVPWVLVCDDTASIRLLIRINLELAGFEVLEAADGSAALALIRQHRDRPPAVLVLDGQMKPLDGWATIAELRSDTSLAAVPIIMVTAALQQREDERAYELGVDAFVAKPFEPEELVEIVTRLARAGSP